MSIQNKVLKGAWLIGKPTTVEELSKNTGFTKTQILCALNDLKHRKLIKTTREKIYPKRGGWIFGKLTINIYEPSIKKIKSVVKNA